MDITSIPDHILQAELDRRKKASEEATKKYIAEHTIRVRCPTCRGSGIETYYNMEVAVGADDGKRNCSLCGGSGRIDVMND